MFRKDVRDTLFDAIFDRYKINLLSAPYERIEPGSIVAVAGEQAIGPMEGARILAGLVLPSPSRGRSIDIEHRSTEIRVASVQLSFLEKLFSRFLPADWAAKLGAKAELKGAAKAKASFDDVYRVHIDPSAIAVAIHGKAVSLDMFAGEVPMLYIVSDVFVAKGLKMTWIDEGGNDIGAKVGLPAAASLEGAWKARFEEAGTFNSKGVEFAFGVRLLPIANENGKARLQLKYAPAGVLAEGGKADDFVLVGQHASLKLIPFEGACQSQTAAQGE